MTVEHTQPDLFFLSNHLCPVSNLSFATHVAAHFSHPIPRPYVFSLVKEASGMYYFADLVSLAQSNRTYEKVHCYVLKIGHTGLFAPFITMEGPIHEDQKQLLVAFSPHKSAEVDAARKKFILRRSVHDIILQELCRRVLHDNPDDIIALSELGDILRKNGELDLAACYLTAAIQKGDGSGFSLASLALIHHAKGERVAACLLLLEAVEAEPENAGIKRAVEKVIQEDPLVGGILARYKCALDTYTIRMLLAELAGKAGQYEVALSYLADAGKADPEKWTAYAIYANVLRKMAGQKEGEEKNQLLNLSETYFQYVIDLKVESAFVLSRLGDVYRMQADSDKSIATFNKAIAMNERDAFAWKGLGVISERAGSYNQAVDFYNMVLSISPNWGEVHVSLGRVLLRLGRRAEAAAAFRSALTFDVTNREAEKGLAVIAAEQADEEFADSLIVG